MAQQKGYKCIFVCPDKVSTDKINVLRAYGAEVVVCPTAVDPEHPDSYYNVSDRLVRETPGAWKPDQYCNPNNPRSHYETTGPELWEQTDGRITHFVAGVGTGGTISGTGRYLKEDQRRQGHRSSAPTRRARSTPAAPGGRTSSRASARTSGRPPTTGPSTDEIVAVSDKDSFQMTRRLAKEEGLLVGGSCGMAVVGGAAVAERLGPDDVVVVLLPDSGRGYLSKIFNDEWMADYGFLEDGRPTAARVGDVLRHKEGGRIPSLVHMHPEETVGEAIEVLREYGVSQMPIVKPGAGHPDVMAAEVVGSVVERELLDALFTQRASLGDPLEKHMSRAAAAGRLRRAGRRPDVRARRRADAAIVLVEGKPTGVVSRQDLLAFLAGESKK